MNVQQMSAIAAAILLAANSSFALNPGEPLPKEVRASVNAPSTLIIPGPYLNSNSCPGTDLGTVNDGDSVVGTNVGFSSNFGFGCGAGGGGADQIYRFDVVSSGFWEMSTCDTATYDTIITLFEDTGGGCPGDRVACNIDGIGCANSTSILQTNLTAGTTYYVVIDTRNNTFFGEFELFFHDLTCTDDADCDDGELCNGVENCDLATGQCGPGPAACALHQTCDPVTNSCLEPDPCLTWAAGAPGNAFVPGGNACSSGPVLTFDDIQTSKHTADVLDHYTLPVFGRSTPVGASPLGSVFFVDLSLWTVTGDGLCNPDAAIAGTECTEAGTIQVGGSPPNVLTCTPAGASLPDNSGDFTRCEVDFFMAHTTTEFGAGWGIARSEQTIGGTGAADDFGVNVFWIEGCPADGVYGPTFFGDDINFPADFGSATVCQKTAAQCCNPDGSCSIGMVDDCTAAGGTVICEGTITDGPCACEGDADGDGIDADCGDNCPFTPNGGQEDGDGDGVGDACDPCPLDVNDDSDGDGLCDSDDLCPDDPNPAQDDCDGDGEGDICEADPADQDGDGDGICNGDDNCVFTPNPGQEDCDSDGLGDACDACPCDAPPEDADGDGVCNSDDICPGHNDNIDSDGDGVPDGCDVCPSGDDAAPGAQDDDDGDGVFNCTDQCPGVDDGIFGPECEGAIPAVSEWGLIVLALLLAAGIKVAFARRRTPYVKAS